MNEDQPISDVIRTREVLIYDDADKLRMTLTAYRGVEPKITFYKEDRTPAIEIASMEQDSDSRRINLFGKAHNWRLRITSNENGAAIFVYDKDGKCLKELTFFDVNEND